MDNFSTLLMEDGGVVAGYGNTATVCQQLMPLSETDTYKEAVSMSY